MLWVIEKNMFYANDQMQFIDYLKNNLKPHLLVDVIPFTHEVIPMPKITNNIVVMGSTLLVKVAKERGWGPGVWISNYHSMAMYNEIFKHDMLNFESIIMKFKDIKFTDRKFIRPVEDLKLFNGQIVHSDNLNQWKDYVVSYANGADVTITDNTEVLIAPVQLIKEEYRFFIINKNIVTGCQYNINGNNIYNSNVPKHIELEAQKWANIYTPSVAVVMDVAITDKNELKIIEFNNFNSAGLYACDVEKIILGIESLF